MTTEQNKETVRRFFTAFEKSDADSLREVLANDLVAYTHNQPEPQGREAHVAGILMWHAAFADTSFQITLQVAEGDTVVSVMTMRAVHSRGEFQGRPPTGSTIEIQGVTIERLRDGQIVERRVYSDWLGIMQQLGVLPVASEA